MANLKVINVTKKGQFTIPKGLREKYGFKDKVMMEEDKSGILIRPFTSTKNNVRTS
jgi:AbrB family looped-hinge helix DNA binding protein